MNDFETTFSGPDDNGHCWVTVISNGETNSLNLGPRDVATEAASQWLASIEERDPD